jgi:ATP-dependent DNA helicase RecG
MTKTTSLNAEALRKTLITTTDANTLACYRTPPVPAELQATLAAMANTNGGRVVIGAYRDEIIGVSDDKSVLDRLLTAALSLEPPLITPLPESTTLDGKTIITMSVPAGMPHVYMYDGRYLARRAGQNAPLRPRALHQLLIQRGAVAFETEPAPGATFDALNWEKVLAYMDKIRVSHAEASSFLIKRGCLVDQDGTLLPTNAGILLFGKDPSQHLRTAEITAVRFAGATMSDTFSRQDINGTLPDQIRRAETFLIDHLRKGVKLKGTMARQENLEYPMEAAREVVVNAVAHRNYSIRGDGIRLFLFKDRMEVYSPGALPGPVTVDNIRDERFSRNPAIVQVLSDMGFIERLGYGIDRMLDLMKQNNLREPEFEETTDGFRVQLFNTPLKPTPRPIPIPVDTNDALAEYADTPLNPRQEAALIHLHTGANRRITNSELQAMFPDVHPETIRRDLADLVTKDITTKMGQKRGSYYVLKPTDSTSDDES